MTPDELNQFLEAGWWVVGPFPKTLMTPCPPEHDPDPARPVPAADGAATLPWRPVATGPRGDVDLLAVFNANDISAYALTYVYSPDERTATLLIGGDDRVRVWLNGRPIHETTKCNNALGSRSGPCDPPRRAEYHPGQGEPGYGAALPGPPARRQPD